MPKFHCPTIVRVFPTILAPLTSVHMQHLAEITFPEIVIGARTLPRESTIPVVVSRTSLRVIVRLVPVLPSEAMAQ